MKKRKNKQAAKMTYQKPDLIHLSSEAAVGGCKSGSVANGTCGVGAVPSGKCTNGTAVA